MMGWVALGYFGLVEIQKNSKILKNFSEKSFSSGDTQWSGMIQKSYGIAYAA